MKILIAPDKFKGSLNSQEVCNAIEEGIIEILPDTKITKLPLADGGEGSLDIINKKLDFEKVEIIVSDPLFRPIKSYYGLLNDTAFIEMALASGLQILNEKERNPMTTTSLGTGELLFDAIKRGAKKINLFVGGSATNDAGIGIATALGIQFNDENGLPLKPIGRNLIRISNIDINNALSLKNIELNILTDVNNILFGKDGASYMFAKQKGADENEIEYLDKGLKNISEIITKTIGENISKIPGSGAAGGVFAGISIFCNTKIKSGTDLILDLLNVNGIIQQSDLIITGEGLLDSQTLKGKVVKGILDRTKKFNKKTIIICGDTTLPKEEINKLGVVNIKTIKTKNISKEKAMLNAYSLLKKRTKEIFKKFV
jgi:glycerate kinase